MQKYLFKRGTYFNHSNESRKKHLNAVIRSFWATTLSRLLKKNRRTSFSPAIRSGWTFRSEVLPKSFEPVLTWIGQSTFLIQIGGINILTDPIFGDIGFGFKRNFPPGIKITDLPKIDYVLISHNHKDHMEARAIKYLKEKYDPIFFVPQGNKKWFLKRDIQRVIEMNWGEEKRLFFNEELDFEIKFYMLPAHHWSSRKLFDINKALWGSWLIEFNDFKIYFAGDSAYGEHYKKIGKKFGDIDVSLLPIGPNEPKRFVIHSHLSTEQACQAFLDLNSRYFVPMHWGTFRLCFDNFDEPIKRLKLWWYKQKDIVKQKSLKVLKFGEPLILKFYPRLDRVKKSKLQKDKSM